MEFIYMDGVKFSPKNEILEYAVSNLMWENGGYITGIIDNFDTEKHPEDNYLHIAVQYYNGHYIQSWSGRKNWSLREGCIVKINNDGSFKIPIPTLTNYFMTNNKEVKFLKVRLVLGYRWGNNKLTWGNFYLRKKLQKEYIYKYN